MRMTQPLGRPMTTSNSIITNYIKAYSSPLEAIHSQGDSLTYVFRKTGLSSTKQEINLAQGNDMAVVAQGLTEEDEVLLSIPRNADEKPITYLEDEPVPLTELGND